MAVFEGKKSSNDIIDNDTISDDEVVASYVPPRYLFPSLPFPFLPPHLSPNIPSLKMTPAPEAKKKNCSKFSAFKSVADPLD